MDGMNDLLQHGDHRERLCAFEESFTEHRRLEAALSRSSEWKETIMGGLQEPVSHHGGDFRLVRANPVASRYLGRRRDRPIGMYCFEAWEGRSTPGGQCPWEGGKGHGPDR